MPALTSTKYSIKPRPITREEKEAYDRDGYVLLRQMIMPEHAAQLREELLDIMAKIGLGVSKLRQTHQYLRDSALDHFINSEVLRQVASDLTGGPATLYSPFSAVKSGGGGGKFHFHQDNQYTKLDGPSVNLWTAMNRMSPENGCLQVVPGSHLQGTLASEQSGDGDHHRKITCEPEDFVNVEMEAGDCVAFTRLTVHGSGPNLTDEHRVAYGIQYHRDDVNWLRDGEWIPLKQFPRFTDLGPVDGITIPKEGKRDGH